MVIVDADGTPGRIQRLRPMELPLGRESVHQRDEASVVGRFQQVVQMVVVVSSDAELRSQ